MLSMSDIYPLFASQSGGHGGAFSSIKEKMYLKINLFGEELGRGFKNHTSSGSPHL
jgi:hypothetical protein